MGGLDAQVHSAARGHRRCHPDRDHDRLLGIIQLAPGDPAQLQTSQIADATVSQRVYEQLRELYGLDKPIHIQYASWLGRLARGDLGNSFHDGRRVSRKIGEALWQPCRSL